MTLLQILKKTRLPQKEVELLFSFLLNKEREHLLAHPEINISANIYKKFKNLEKKRLSNWSIAVLTEQKYFYGLNFKVNKNVLIPRPETEMIIDEIIKEGISKNIVVDLGTGSGAIIISLAKKIPSIKSIFLAVDISAPALVVARKNAKIHRVHRKIRFFRGNLLLPIYKFLKGKDLIITANLPYLTKKQIINSPSIKREPRIALDGGQDGLKYYKNLFKQLADVNYKSLILLAEIDPSQNKKIRILAKQYFSSECLEIKKDLAGHNRLLIIKKPRD